MCGGKLLQTVCGLKKMKEERGQTKNKIRKRRKRGESEKEDRCDSSTEKQVKSLWIKL